MSITEKSVKLLWGRAADRCSRCRSECSHTPEGETADFPLGEMAHIVGEKDTSPRGKSNLSAEERDDYSNLMLLCRKCHKIVDTDEATYSVEKLHFIKDKHELWVRETLTKTTTAAENAAETAYADMVDAAALLCHFDDWNNWTSEALGPSAKWPSSVSRDIKRFANKVRAGIWPGAKTELELAIKTLAASTEGASEALQLHCGYGHGDLLRRDKFYRDGKIWHSEIEYAARLRQFTAYVAACDELIAAATMAANWVSDVVRRELNPAFRITQGKFCLFWDGEEAVVLEFSEVEKKEQPAAIEQRTREVVQQFREVNGV